MTRRKIKRFVACSLTLMAGFILMASIKPLSSSRAISLAKELARAEVGNNIDEYSISVLERTDWFEEWQIQFSHKTSLHGMLITVIGGDIYNGHKVKVIIDNKW